jgi:hypothetical protein
MPPHLPLPSAGTRIGLHWVLMAMWEMTITCHDGTRLRLSEWRDPAPQKDEVAGQTIKVTIDSWREEKVGGSRPFFFRSQRPKSKVDRGPSTAFTALDATK